MGRDEGEVGRRSGEVAAESAPRHTAHVQVRTVCELCEEISNGLLVECYKWTNLS